MKTEKHIDEIIEDRQKAREEKNWKLSDELRDYLDSKNVFVFDTKNGQEVYYPASTKTRKQVEKEIQDDIKYNKIFDSWLYSTRVC